MTDTPTPTAPETDELLPCPFCGGPADHNLDHTVEQSHWIGCRNCCFEISAFSHPDYIAAWNSRAPSPEVATLRESEARLQEALVEHNDLLRSTFAIAEREGIKGMVASTNWDAFYNRVAVLLKRHHALGNEARAALQGETK